MERTVPNPPELVAPVQGAPVRGDAAKLVWEPAEGATAYRVQAAADEGFTQLLVDARITDATALVVERVLHGGEGTVFWRVAAVGPGGQGAYSAAAEFFSSAGPAEAPHAGLTAEAGAETGTHGAERDPAPVRHFRTGRTEFGIFVGAILLCTLIVGVTFVAFPGLADRDVIVARDSVSQALQMEQLQMAERLERYHADSTGYAIPIDTAIARMAGRADTANVLPAVFSDRRD